MKYAVIGFGSRGQTYTKNFVGEAELVAVCDKNQHRLDDAMNKYGVKKENTYLVDEEFFAQGKLADLLVVSTQDADHYGHAMKALDLGYNLLLEKPMADSYERCLDIYRKANEKGLEVFVCHVLRYAPFFQTIKEIIDEGTLGKIMTINLTENVAWWHQAHSYVRGHWRVMEQSTPTILAKSCHDLDILYWFMNCNCDSVSSYGSLDYYTKENAPVDSTEYCCDCKVDCPYNAYNYYKTNRGWLFNCIPNSKDPADYTDQELYDALARKDHPYGKCVFKSNNTAVDHQVVNMQFENGATAHLTMTAFSDQCYREIHVHGTKGNIYGSMQDNKLTLCVYGKQPEVIDVTALSDGKYGHGGGDRRLTMDIVAWFNGKESKGSTRIANSLMSHKMGYAAEYSRLHGGEAVDIKD